MKQCVDCRWRVNRNCILPDHKTGLSENMWCSIMRDKYGKCGIDGNYWEPIPPKKPWWKKLFGSKK